MNFINNNIRPFLQTIFVFLCLSVFCQCGGGEFKEKNNKYCDTVLFVSGDTVITYNDRCNIVAKGRKKDKIEIGHWKYFYRDDGKLHAEGEMDNGQHIGIWIYFHRNGKIEKTGEYLPETIAVKEVYVPVEDTSITSIITTITYENIKHDVWKYYSEDGKLIKEEFWDIGKLMETKLYDENGKIKNVKKN